MAVVLLVAISLFSHAFWLDLSSFVRHDDDGYGVVVVGAGRAAPQQLQWQCSAVAAPSSLATGAGNSTAVMIEETPSASKQASSKSDPDDVPLVDVLSIASATRQEVVNAQKETWGSHHTIRNFLTVTEEDDPDPQCNVNFTDDRAFAYSGYCKKRSAWPKSNFLTKHFTTSFARPQWLAKKKDAGAWLCAQRRMAAGLAKVGRIYRSSGEIPAFLVLVDDDTYVNMDRFEKEVLCNMSGDDNNSTVMEDGADASAKVYAGCVVVASPGQLIQWTIPFGGWGTFFSRGAIKRLVMPLHCNETNLTQPFEAAACQRLTGGEDLLSESQFFKDGMSISDLMGTLASQTEKPYCLHSDW